MLKTKIVTKATETLNLLKFGVLHTTVFPGSWKKVKQHFVNLFKVRRKGGRLQKRKAKTKYNIGVIMIK